MDITTAIRPKLLLAGVIMTALLAFAVQVATPPAAAQDVAYTPDEMHVVLGFTVEITGAGSGGGVDSAWETMSGGSLNIEVADSSVGTDQHHTTTPGHKYVDVLTLRGPLTSAVGKTRKDVNEGSYEVLENGAGKFAVDLGGLPLRGLEEVSIDDLTIDVEEDRRRNPEYRVYGPGDAHFGSITIRSRVGANSKELYQWWLDTSQGKNIRKQISVIANKRDGTEGRRYDFQECFPTSYSPFGQLPGVVVEEIDVTCATAEFSGTGERKALMEWLNGTVRGEPWKRTVVVKEILKDGSAGASYSYEDGFPTRYVFPNLSASGTGNLYEEITLKPIRLELN